MKQFVVLLLGIALWGSLTACDGKRPQKKEVVFTISNGAEPETLDPHLASGAPAVNVIYNLFEGLVGINPETGLAIPGVAERWESDPSGSTLTFYLRETTWSDGVPITAQTVYDSWMRILAPETGSPYAELPGLLIKGGKAYSSGEGSAEDVGLRVIDERTFEVTLSGAAPFAVHAINHPAFAIVPLHIIETYGALWTDQENMVVNGAFALESWRAQEHIVLVPNPHYWDEENVKLDRAVFLPTEDGNTAYKMCLNGEIDWLPAGIPSDKMAEALRRSDVHAGPFFATYYYSLNVEKPPLDNYDVRSALALSVDRVPLVERVLKAGQKPALTFVPPFIKGYRAPTGDAFDVERAREHLAEAGYPNGQGFPQLTVLYNTSEGHKKVAEYIQSQWEEHLGITVELQNMEWKSFLPATRKGDFQIARTGWIGGYLDPTTFLDLLRTGNAQNSGQWSHPGYDRLLDEAIEAKGAERMTTLAEAEALMLSDRPIIPLYFYVRVTLIDTEKWGGWYANPLARHPLKSIYRKP